MIYCPRNRVNVLPIMALHTVSKAYFLVPKIQLQKNTFQVNLDEKPWKIILKLKECSILGIYPNGIFGLK